MPPSRELRVSHDSQPSPNLPRRVRTVEILFGNGEPVSLPDPVKLLGQGPSASDIVIEDRG